MKRAATREAPEVQVATRGQMPEDSAEQAREKMLALVAHVRQPILSIQVKLTWMPNPARERRAIAQGTLNVNGRPVRASVAAESMPSAITLLYNRLAGRLDRMGENWEARRGSVPVPHEWRHGSEPTQRPEYFPRPVEDRQIVRHKSFSLARETPDEAAYELESMDYTFHLFTDADSGQDSVIYQDEPGGYRMAQVHPRPDRLGPVAVPLTMSELPAPRMSVAEAEKRLDLTGMPFVFFADEATGRGNILYHRYDGHYGLITPVE